MLSSLSCFLFQSILNTCASKVYMNIGSMYFDFQMHEKVLDVLIDLLQKDQLEENRKNLDMVEKVSTHLEVMISNNYCGSLIIRMLIVFTSIPQTIYKNHLSAENFDNITFLEDFIAFSTFSCDSISIYLQYINSVVQVRDDQIEIMQLLKELNINNEEFRVFLRNALKRLPEGENEKKIVLCLPAELQAQLDKCIVNFFKVSKTLKELNHLTLNSSEYNTSGELYIKTRCSCQFSLLINV